MRTFDSASEASFFLCATTQSFAVTNHLLKDFSQSIQQKPLDPSQLQDAPIAWRRRWTLGSPSRRPSPSFCACSAASCTSAEPPCKHCCPSTCNGPAARSARQKPRSVWTNGFYSRVGLLHECATSVPPFRALSVLHRITSADLGDSGVAVGSSIGHAIGGMFGGSSSQPTEQQQADTSVAAQDGQFASTAGGYGARSCDTDASAFTKCMDEYKGNMQICSWYLEQLVSCDDFLSKLSELEADLLLESVPTGR